MELRHLRYFLSIMKLGSFTKAAEELSVTQPTLSHQIRQLEEELGCELLDRTSRNVRLTNAGEIFSNFARRSVKEVENGKAAIQEFRGLRVGSLAMGVVSAFINNIMPSVISRFQSEYPGINLKVLELPTGELGRQVSAGDLAFGFAYGPSSTDQVIWEELFKERLCLIVSKRHEFSKYKSVSFEEISKTPLALLTREYLSRKMIDTAFLEAVRSPQIGIEMNSIEALLQTVANTGLATILTPRIARTSRNLVAVPILPAVERSAGIFTRQGATLPPAARVIVDMIRQVAREDSAGSKD